MIRSSSPLGFSQKENEERIAKQIAETYNLPYLDLFITPIQTRALSIVKKSDSEEAELAVIRKTKRGIQVVVLDIRNERTNKILDDLKKQHKIVEIFIVSKSGLNDVLKNYPKEAPPKKQIVGRVEISPEAVVYFQNKVTTIKDVQALIEETTKSDASELLAIILGAALKLNASDIHVEPHSDTNIVRMRIDGILYETIKLDSHLYSLVLSRIKLLSELKLNIHNEAQEGRFSISLNDKDIEIRTSVLPSQYAEDIALRILDPKALLSLSELGLRPDLEKILRHHLMQPQGLVVVTGPTGAGKSTTLYASVLFLKKPEIKIVTVENPIEYELEGITQTQIDKKTGHGFEEYLRAILRQDPNIVLMGEIRGKEEAVAALQAALAGRLVLSTLHTIDAAGTAPRLIDLEIDPATIASGLSASIAQRLVRKLCEVCKKSVLIDKDILKLSKIMEGMPQDIEFPNITVKTTIFEASENGCEACANTGYKGRIAVFEILSNTKEVLEQIMKKPSEEEVRELAQKLGMSNMKQDAVIKILQGITSIQEVERVLGEM